MYSHGKAVLSPWKNILFFDLIAVHGIFLFLLRAMIHRALQPLKNYILSL